MATAAAPVTGASLAPQPFACVSLPAFGTPPTVSLPFGDMSAFGDFTTGLPSQCTMNFNLLIQLQPLLVSMGCLLKILNVIGKLEDVMNALNPPNPFQLAEVIPKLIGAIAACGPCLPPVAFPALFITIKQILQLILSILKCFVDQLKSIIDFQASIDVSSADGNPALQQALQCAQTNADNTMAAISGSLGAMQPMLDIVTMICGIIGLSVTIPQVKGLAVAGDMAKTIDSLDSTLGTLQQVIDGIPTS